MLNDHAIKRKIITEKLNWDKKLKLAGAAKLKDILDMLDTLKEMNKIQNNIEKPDTNKAATTTIKITPEGSCFRTDAEKGN